MGETNPAVDGAIPFTLDGKELLARPGELVIAAAARHGVEIPHFCYHPRMRPVGMCRMCLVEIDTGRGPSLQPSCMLEVSEGMVVDTQGDVTKKTQDGVLEFLLINHPLDCPVCDKGGECPLQDQTLAYGPGESRFVEEKRHHEKPIPISSLVLLDRERCILCDRCTRFAAEVAGDALIHFIDRGAQTQINTFPDHPFASYFSGNTVQICPVGALTAVPYRFKARPWDLEVDESTCTSCALGCRISVQTSRDRLLRFQGVDCDAVNWGWLCDKGRFSYEAVHHQARLSEPLLREGDALVEVSWSSALGEAAAMIRSALDASGPSAVGMICGARLANEDAYAWSKLARAVVGTDNVDCQLGDGLPAELVLGLPRATINEVCEPGGTVIIVAGDLREELPVLYLRLRHAVLNDGVKLIEISPRTTSLTPLAAASLHPRPGEAGAAAAALVEGTSGGGGASLDGGGVDPESLKRATEILAAAQGPVKVVVGRASIAETDSSTAGAASALVASLEGVHFLPALRRANAAGALDMGLAPGMLPGRVSLEEGREWFTARWGSLPGQRGLSTLEMLRAASAGEIQTLVVVGADLFDFPDRDLARRALGNTKVIVVDLFENDTTGLADVVLPAAGFAERDGTTTNIEGRISPVSQRVNAPGTCRADWMIAVDLAARLGSDLGLESLSQIWEEISSVSPLHHGLTWSGLRRPSSPDGILAPVADPPAASPRPLRFEAPAVLAEPPALDAYALRLVATRRLYDCGTMCQHAPSLAPLAEGTAVSVNPYDFARLGVAEGDLVTVSSGVGSLQAEVVADAGVPRGSAHMVVLQPGAAVTELIDSGRVVTDVHVEVAEAPGEA